MSIESRLEIILATHSQHQTLIDIESEATKIAEGYLIGIGGHSKYQYAAAKRVVDLLGIKEGAARINVDPIWEILYLCAITRPQPIYNVAKKAHYENWKKQHEDLNLALSWLNEIRAMSNKSLEALGSHLRLDDYSNEAFITSFKEGTVHRHDGRHGDKLDFATNSVKDI